MKVIWTKHAEDRQKVWEKKTGITKQEVEYIVRVPEQIVPGRYEHLCCSIKESQWLIEGSLCRD